MKCTEHDKVMPHYRCEESERWLDERTPKGAVGCERCEILRKEVRFWHEQQRLAADVVTNLADLNDYDGRVAALRSLLAKEIERRRAAERQVDVLTYRLQQTTAARTES